jgi:hypothetical protein
MAESLEGKSAAEIEALANLALSLTTGKTRARALALTKELHPDASIPEIDIPASMQAMFAPQTKELEDLKAKMAEQELRGRIESTRRQLGVSETELAAIEKTMVEHKIADHSTAKTFMDMQARQAEPSAASLAAGARRFELPKVDAKLSHQDMQSASRQMAYQVIDELRGRRAAA